MSARQRLVAVATWLGALRPVFILLVVLVAGCTPPTGATADVLLALLVVLALMFIVGWIAPAPDMEAIS